MSASLVGSEMCIRDRFRPVALRQLGRLWPCQWQTPRCSRRRRGAAPVLCCLLYTSDAADDM
eukprot:1629449-Alexandrium_andersonii.AAC.1